MAAKVAARRMASVLGEDVGQTVGYRVRLEAQVYTSQKQFLYWMEPQQCNQTMH